MIHLGTSGESLTNQRVIRLLNGLSMLLILVTLCFQSYLWICFLFNPYNIILGIFSVIIFLSVLKLNKIGRFRVSKYLFVIYANIILAVLHVGIQLYGDIYVIFFAGFAFYVALFDHWVEMILISLLTLIIMILGIHYRNVFDPMFVLDKEYSYNLKIIFVVISTIIILFVTFFLKTNFQFQQNELELSLQEKNTMLREVHHRVKNNLQVISSILNIQKRRLSSDQKETREIIESGQNRMQSMVLIHQEMYNREGAGNINLNEYIRKLAINIHVLFKKKTQSIDLIFDLDEIIMDLEKTMSIGLMLNEILTNAFKHAFKEREFGQIDIKLKSDKKFCIIDVQDNGVGFYEDDKNLGNGMGAQLIDNICNQLQGRYNVIQVGGTKYIITFPK